VTRAPKVMRPPTQTEEATMWIHSKTSSAVMGRG
jgi:hypothetical protein